ncbi:hypothetical protein [Bradyrhizobium elkanii]|uniref:hypothetical protein n=1 Tax=Bradyrhizobium elkanii TaxID=29448 RepID=UPI0020A04712|nr:hypothetical protein [Bradyrhizobium elkanii]MCP1966705.1 hypothetical protein [Bradyrhizobium elkanii]MCS4111791.1 hypothetical protein [Bradyrhizobium elkanii]
MPSSDIQKTGRGAMLRSGREDLRDVKRLGGDEPPAVDPMKHQMVDEAGLAGPDAHLGDRQIGRGLVDADDGLLARDFIDAGEGRLRMKSRNSAADRTVCLPSRMPCTMQASAKTSRNRLSSTSYIRLKYPSIADAMAWMSLIAKSPWRMMWRWPHRIEPVICADSGRYAGGVLRLGGHLLDD